MACGGCAKRAGKLSYVHKDARGNETVYGNEYEARAAVARKGGTYTVQK